MGSIETTHYEWLAPILTEFSRVKEVKAIVMAGSRLGKYGDDFSDFDFYIYSDEEISLKIRTGIAHKYASCFEIGTQFYENTDEWRLKDSGMAVEFIYRHRCWIEEQIDRVWIHGGASLGYSTCFIYNVKNSRIFHDDKDWYKELQKVTMQKYPDILRENIIKKNVAVLYSKINSPVYKQIEYAVKRKDSISINHRVSVFIASYFDIIFALNRVLYPGEKFLLQYAQDTCSVLPDLFEENITNLLSAPDNYKMVYLDDIVCKLKAVL